MKTYTLDKKCAKAQKRKLLRRILWQFPLWMIFYLAFFGLSTTPPESITPKMCLLALLSTLGLSILKWFYLTDRVKRYKLLVDENGICALCGNSAQSVPKGEVRTLFETRNGLFLSDRTPLSARLKGYLWIPSELPEYSELKSLTLSWKQSSTLSAAAN